MSKNEGPMVKLNKPDGMIEMYFWTENEAKDRAWEHWLETHPDAFSEYTKEEITAVINNWKLRGFPPNYWVSYSMTDAAVFGEEDDDHLYDDYDDEDE